MLFLYKLFNQFGSKQRRSFQLGQQFCKTGVCVRSPFSAAFINSPFFGFGFIDRILIPDFFRTGWPSRTILRTVEIRERYCIDLWLFCRSWRVKITSSRLTGRLRSGDSMQLGVRCRSWHRCRLPCTPQEVLHLLRPPIDRQIPPVSGAGRHCNQRGPAIRGSALVWQERWDFWVALTLARFCAGVETYHRSFAVANLCQTLDNLKLQSSMSRRQSSVCPFWVARCSAVYPYDPVSPPVSPCRRWGEPKREGDAGESPGPRCSPRSVPELLLVFLFSCTLLFILFLYSVFLFPVFMFLEFLFLWPCNSVFVLWLVTLYSCISVLNISCIPLCLLFPVRLPM